MLQFAASFELHFTSNLCIQMCSLWEIDNSFFRLLYVAG